MKSMLLNRISASASFSSDHKKRFEKVRERVKHIEQRKMDNLRKTATFLKEMGQQDVAYFKTNHQELVEAFQKKYDERCEPSASSTSSTVYPDEVTVVDEDDIFDN